MSDVNAVASLGAFLGRKVGMTQVFDDAGKAIPVTVIEAGPCTVIQVRTPERDGYSAVQLGFDEVAPRKLDKPMKGVFQKAGVKPFRVLREVRTADASGFQAGQVYTADLFRKGQYVDVSGVTIGRGFQGVMKRLNYTGGRSSHGSMFRRAPGSIGANTFPGRVWKGKGMPGHMGNERVTILKLEVVRVDSERNLLVLRGAVPGAEGGLLEIRPTNRTKKFWKPIQRSQASVGKKAKSAAKAAKPAKA